MGCRDSNKVSSRAGTAVGARVQPATAHASKVQALAIMPLSHRQRQPPSHWDWVRGKRAKPCWEPLGHLLGMGCVTHLPVPACLPCPVRPAWPPSLAPASLRWRPKCANGQRYLAEAATGASLSVCHSRRRRPPSTASTGVYLPHAVVIFPPSSSSSSSSFIILPLLIRLASSSPHLAGPLSIVLGVSPTSLRRFCIPAAFSCLR